MSLIVLPVCGGGGDEATSIPLPPPKQMPPLRYYDYPYDYS